MPAVSIIIPAYGHRDFILATLESAFAQSFTDHEIIVINDGSPDDSAELLRPAAASGRIRYIEQANAGVAAARNRGLAEARGEFIALLDDDDLWPADKLAWQVEALRSNPDLSAVGGQVQLIDSSGSLGDILSYAAGPVTFESLFDGNPFHSPGQTLIRADRLRAAGGFDASIWGADDFDLWFRLARTGPIVKSDRLSLLYRLHPTNASKDLSRMFRQTLAVIRRHIADAPDRRQRRKLDIRGHRFIYTYLVRSILHSVKTRVKHGDFSTVGTLAGPLRTMSRSFVTDARLLWWFLKDLLPARKRRDAA